MGDFVFRIQEPGRESSREIKVSAGMKIGRDATNDIVLEDQNVSGQARQNRTDE